MTDSHSFGALSQNFRHAIFCLGSGQQIWWCIVIVHYLGFSNHDLLHPLLTKVGELRPVEHHRGGVRLVRLIEVTFCQQKNKKM